jgi:hypothetical protein
MTAIPRRPPTTPPITIPVFTLLDGDAVVLEVTVDPPPVTVDMNEFVLVVITVGAVTIAPVLAGALEEVETVGEVDAAVEDADEVDEELEEPEDVALLVGADVDEVSFTGALVVLLEVV